MQDQIITQQIDVIVVGQKQQQLMELMLGRQIYAPNHHPKRPHPTYLQLLQQLLPLNVLPKEAKRVNVATDKHHRHHEKLTKVILTESFWIHIHFLMQDNRLFDPLAFEATKGNVSICLLASAENADLTPTKNYLHQAHPATPAELTLRDRNKVVKPENVVEGKIFSLMHEMSISGFPSVLALKITQQKRIIEDSSNLRLTVNQIARWIVDRHFQNRHSIKIRQQLGDEIENMEQKPQKGYCSVM